MQQDLDGKWRDAGLELIEIYRHPTTPRLKRVYLTERGKQFAEKLKRVLATGEVPVRPMAPQESV
jgi:hypothetical protein